MGNSGWGKRMLNRESCSVVYSYEQQVTRDGRMAKLTTEAVKRAALALEGVDDIHRDDCLATSMLCVGDSVADDGLEEDLENVAGLLVDEA